VLLKNQGDLLPLSRTKIKSIAVIGPNAFPALPAGGGSAQVRPFAPVSFLEGLTAAFTEGGPAARVSYNRGVPTLAEIFDSTSFLTSPNDGKPGLVGEYFSDPSLNGHAVLTRVD
jgi:beta-glucosidase